MRFMAMPGKSAQGSDRSVGAAMAKNALHAIRRSGDQAAGGECADHGCSDASASPSAATAIASRRRSAASSVAT